MLGLIHSINRLQHAYMHGSLTNQFEGKYAVIVLTPNVLTSGLRCNHWCCRGCDSETKLSHQSIQVIVMVRRDAIDNAKAMYWVHGRNVHVWNLP